MSRPHPWRPPEGSTGPWADVSLLAFQPTLGYRLTGEVIVHAERVHMDEHIRLMSWIHSSVMTRLDRGATLHVRYV